MKFVKQYAGIICCIIITALLCGPVALFTNKYPDYLFFTNLILSLIIVTSIGTRLFCLIDGKSFVTYLGCDIVLVIAANKLYSYRQLEYIKSNFLHDSLYLSLIGFVVVATAILLIVKLMIWAHQKDNTTAPNNHTISAPIPVNGGGATDPASQLSSSNIEKTKNSVGYTISIIGVVVVISIVTAIIVSLVYKNNTDYSWKTILEMCLSALCVIVGISITLYIFVLIAKAIVNLVRYKESDSSLFSQLSKYRFSILITSCLFCILYIYKGKYGYDDLISLLTDGINEVLAIPLAFCTIFSAFLVVVMLIHYILQIFSVSEDHPDVAKLKKIKNTLSDDVFKIAKQLYEIVIDSVNNILKFAKIIPDYITTISELVLYCDDESTVRDEGTDVCKVAEDGEDSNGSEALNNSEDPDNSQYAADDEDMDCDGGGDDDEN